VVIQAAWPNFLMKKELELQTKNSVMPKWGKVILKYGYTLSCHLSINPD
jgi:hypothetical protein